MGRGVTSASPIDSDSDCSEEDDNGRHWPDDDYKSTGSLGDLGGILEGGSSDVENFRARLEGFVNMVILPDTIYGDR